MTKHPNGWKVNGREYVRKSTLIRTFVKELVNAGEPVTHSAVMAMLDRERPGHRTFPTEISRALLGAAPAGARRRDGQRVEADGVAYPSLASAGEAHGISKEAARKRINSPHFPTWKLLG
ncbi:hypothetical protein ACFQ4O_03800 [Methylopila musalis]|uniref:Uncharacterized protein n=1 Tax=Methylopila musalis TaxID=1134781 RepID=A0ABW3Z598_9HYPH